MTGVEDKRIAPNNLPSTRKRIALVALLGIVATGVFVAAPRIPRDLEVRLNLAHMERGAGGRLTVRELEGLRLEIFRHGKSIEQITIAVPPPNNPVKSLHVKLASGRYRFLVTLRFRTEQGRVFDRFTVPVILEKQRYVMITP